MNCLRRLLRALFRRQAAPSDGTRIVLPRPTATDTTRPLPLLPPGPDELAVHTRLLALLGEGDPR